MWTRYAVAWALATTWPAVSAGWSWGARMTAYIAIRIGNCSRSGRHPPKGFTPASLYSFIVSSWILALLPLNFFCSSLTFGWIDCIACIDLICFTPRGSRTTLITMVRTMIDRP